MVKRLTFSTLFLLSLHQLVSGSRSPTATGTAAQGGPACQLTNVASASSDLPQPPVALTDRLPEPTVLIQRVPITLKNYNANSPRIEIANVPPGLEIFYHDIMNEMLSHHPNHRATLMTFLEIIINDRADQFIAFESTFKKTFGTNYKNFISADRTVMGLLVTFGSIEILTTYDFNGFEIDDAELDPSIKFLVKKHLLNFVARFVSTAAPSLVTAKLPSGMSLLRYVMDKEGADPLTNLTVFFSELLHVDSNYIVALIPILPHGGKSDVVTELLTLVHNICNSIRTSNAIGKPPSLREKAIKKLRLALQQFFSLCLTDYSAIGHGDRFTVANLFMDAGNATGLERLLIAQPDMVDTLANGKTLLQNCIDSASYNCSAVVARFKPNSIFGIYNGLQSPFFQSIIYGNDKYFHLFFPYLRSNEILPVSGSEFGLSPISMAMIYGNIPFLAEIVHHFNQNQIPYDMRACFETAFNFLDANYVQANGISLRTTTLLPHAVWLYMLDFPGIYNESSEDPQRITLLDLAVIDRNPEAARLIINKFGPEVVNHRHTGGRIHGNCLRYYKNDLNMLKLLVLNNIDINTPFDRIIFDEQGSRIERVPVITHLMVVFDSESLAFIRTLHFDEETLRHCFDYSKSKTFIQTMNLSAELLRTRYGVTVA